MRYTVDITIALPRDKVIEKMDKPENLKHWQKGLTNYELLEGTPGQEGAKMKLEYQMGKRDMTLIETILKREFPKEFHATYDTKGVHNIQKNYFEELDETTTKWISESEFQFSGLGMKLMGWLMPGAFKKQSKKYMEDFKNFAEKGTSVAKITETNN
ncbi:SRPBCC family protein [Marixanthomonas spongiae]|uniref:SRPBCC family protein n=1 Tax=Marixanthomonas spongiae TaxID=2174845 RepID=A0A2U0HW97_9FLAO|nr:SRPBCC family protein [Marixanthomonas spongiae]PVW13099.1 SRPBCC family protein [Marixanthomonas spongiae]